MRELLRVIGCALALASLSAPVASAQDDEPADDDRIQDDVVDPDQGMAEPDVTPTPTPPQPPPPPQTSRPTRETVCDDRQDDDGDLRVLGDPPEERGEVGMHVGGDRIATFGAIERDPEHPGIAELAAEVSEIVTITHLDLVPPECLHPNLREYIYEH